MVQYFNFPLLYDGDHPDEVFVNMSVFNAELSNYFISNYGRVYSWISRRFLKPQMHNGYHYVALGANFRILFIDLWHLHLFQDTLLKGIV